MYYIGIDLGSASVNVALTHASTGVEIKTLQECFADPNTKDSQSNFGKCIYDIYWKYIGAATKKIIVEAKIEATSIVGIGITYQNLDVVIVDNEGTALLNLTHSFCVSKFKILKHDSPEVFKRIHKFMLLGDYIAFKLTEKITITKNELSELGLWNSNIDDLASCVFEDYQIEASCIPDIVDNFTNQGGLTTNAFLETGIPTGTPVIYRAGRKYNNTLSLNVLKNGEVGLTSDSQGVICAVTNGLNSKMTGSMHQFTHVSCPIENVTMVKLLNFNGGALQYRWLKQLFKESSFEIMNRKASEVAIGSNGLTIFPFGNGEEQMLNNKNIGGIINNINLNTHFKAHVYRATLEGIAFAYVYGMDVLKNDGVDIKVIKAKNDEVFKSEIVVNTITSLIRCKIEIYNTSASVGAARACGLINKDVEHFEANVLKNNYHKTFELLKNPMPYVDAYTHWKKELEIILNKN